MSQEGEPAVQSPAEEDDALVRTLLVTRSRGGTQASMPVKGGGGCSGDDKDDGSGSAAALADRSLPGRAAEGASAPVRRFQGYRGSVPGAVSMGCTLVFSRPCPSS